MQYTQDGLKGHKYSSTQYPHKTPEAQCSKRLSMKYNMVPQAQWKYLKVSFIKLGFLY